jgi:Ca2+-binding EF-hand superfamily protein
VAAESIPKSKAETIFNLFQDASINSAAVGRSFLNLCSLIDLRMTGRISKDELLHVSKMMDYELNPYDLEAMLELVPGVLVSTQDNRRDGNRASAIDYRILNNFLQSYTPRDLDNRLFSTNAMSGYVPTPNNPQNSTFSRNMLNSINTPLGQSISTPMRALDSNALSISVPSPFPNANGMLGQSLSASTFFNGTMNNNTAIYEKILKAFADRTRAAIDDRSRSWNTNFSLRNKLENLDLMNSGQIGVRSLQMALEEVGIVPTSSELQALCTIYGRPEDDRLFYDSLCRMIEGNNRDKERERDNLSVDNNSTNFPPSNAQMTTVPYLNARVVQRLRDLKNDGKNPLDLFEVYDLDRTGLVSLNHCG